MNPNILKALNDPSKVRRKIAVPPDPTFNYIGLIIGPKVLSFLLTKLYLQGVS